MGILDAPSAASVPRAIRRRSPATFVVLVVTLSVPFWVVGTFVPGVRLIGLPVSALQFVAPLGAALNLVVRDEGGAAAIALFRRTLAFGSVRPRWLYLPLLTVLPAIYVGSWFLQRAAGRAVPTPDLLIAATGLAAALLVTRRLPARA